MLDIRVLKDSLEAKGIRVSRGIKDSRVGKDGKGFVVSRVMWAHKVIRGGKEIRDGRG